MSEREQAGLAWNRLGAGGGVGGGVRLGSGAGRRLTRRSAELVSAGSGATRRGLLTLKFSPFLPFSFLFSLLGLELGARLVVCLIARKPGVWLGWNSTTYGRHAACTSAIMLGPSSRTISGSSSPVICVICAFRSMMASGTPLVDTQLASEDSVKETASSGGTTDTGGLSFVLNQRHILWASVPLIPRT